MRALLILWFTPLAAFFGWYFLSLADVGSSFGGFFLSRDLNEGIFLIYGHILGVAPERLPGLFAWGIACDSAVLFAIVGYRRRRAIAAWWAGRKDTAISEASPRDDRAHPAG